MSLVAESEFWLRDFKNKIKKGNIDRFTQGMSICDVYIKKYFYLATDCNFSIP